MGVGGCDVCVCVNMLIQVYTCACQEAALSGQFSLFTVGWGIDLRL